MAGGSESVHGPCDKFTGQRGRQWSGLERGVSVSASVLLVQFGVLWRQGDTHSHLMDRRVSGRFLNAPKLKSSKKADDLLQLNLQ